MRTVTSAGAVPLPGLVQTRQRKPAKHRPVVTAACVFCDEDRRTKWQVEGEPACTVCLIVLLDKGDARTRPRRRKQRAP